MTEKKSNASKIKINETSSYQIDFEWSLDNINLPVEINQPVTIDIDQKKDYFRIPYTLLHYFMYKGFVNVGVDPKIATLVAKELTDNDKWGISTHGFNRFYAIYVKKIKQGILDPNVMPTLTNISGACAEINAHNGFGFVAMSLATSLATHLAKIYGTSQVHISESNHCGTGRNWLTKIAEQDMQGIFSTNARPSVAPTNGVEGLFGTNPKSESYPTNLGYPYVADSATSIRHNGNIEKHMKSGIPIPEGWVQDYNGKSLTDAPAAYESLRKGKASFVCIGGPTDSDGYVGHKGYMRSLNVELECGAMKGSFSIDARGLDSNSNPIPHRLGHTIQARSLGNQPTDRNSTKENITKLLKHIKKSKAQPGKTIYIPGEKEYLIEEDNLKNGIKLDSSLISHMKDIQKELNFNIVSFK
jgi:L-2-hydroxycarboxylate dehydrogenase (NAD+)